MSLRRTPEKCVTGGVIFFRGTHMVSQVLGRFSINYFRGLGLGFGLGLGLGFGLGLGLGLGLVW